MKIPCPACGSDANLPGDKIPKNRDFSFKCPSCGASVPVKAQAGISGGGGGAARNSAGPGRGISGFRSGGPGRALVCLAPCPGRSRVAAGLERAGFKVHVPETPARALTHLEHDVYPLVVMDDAFGKAMAAGMNNMDMFLRRKICLVRVGPGFETGNAMTALNLSANYVIKSQDLDQEDAALVGQVFAAALAEHEQMYAVFNDSMKAVGKA